MQRRRLDHLQHRVLELEARLESLATFTGVNDASLADELRAIEDLLPQYREEMRAEATKRSKGTPADRKQT